jgi:hypothetical protein
MEQVAEHFPREQGDAPWVLSAGEQVRASVVECS